MASAAVEKRHWDAASKDLILAGKRASLASLGGKARAWREQNWLTFFRATERPGPKRGIRQLMLGTSSLVVTVGVKGRVEERVSYHLYPGNIRVVVFGPSFDLKERLTRVTQ